MVNVAVLLVIAALVVSLFASADSRLRLYLAVVWVAILTGVYLVKPSRSGILS